MTYFWGLITVIKKLQTLQIQTYVKFQLFLDILILNMIILLLLIIWRKIWFGERSLWYKNSWFSSSIHTFLKKCIHRGAVVLKCRYLWTFYSTNCFWDKIVYFLSNEPDAPCMYDIMIFFIGGMAEIIHTWINSSYYFRKFNLWCCHCR